MNPSKPLEQLCYTFNVEDLGHGDANQGINTLATMAITLANLTPGENTVQTPDGSTAHLGVNLLITGSASAGAVLDEAIIEVGCRQKNLKATLGKYIEWVQEQNEKPGATPLPLGPKSNAPVNAIAQALGDIDPLYGSKADLWKCILNEAPSEQLPDLASHPKLLVTATRARDLESQLRNLRPGRPLVHLGLASASDLVDFAEVGAALAEGRFTSENGDEPVRANILISDPLQVLGEAVKAPSARSAWIGHFLWLCDGNAGPDIPSGDETTGSPETTRERYRRALNHIIIQRVNLAKSEPLVLPWNTRESVVGFRRFLNEMEPRLLGISGAARNLINSLAFGLGEMARIKNSLPITPAGVEALARHLVRRMANTRTMILQAGALAQRQSQIERVFQKLTKGSFDTRTIYKDLRVPASICKDYLNWLQDEGFISKSGKKWQPIEGATLSFANSTYPLLEI